MSKTSYEVGMIVEHPVKPEWGPGKVLSVDGSKLTIHFRDAPRTSTNVARKKINTQYVELNVAASQNDPQLDRLTSLKKAGQRQTSRRLTLDEAIDFFHKQFPLSFDDPDYIGDREKGERAYKWAAHTLFTQTLGAQERKDLVKAGNVQELCNRILGVEAKVNNLLSLYEKMAFRDALADIDAAKRYSEALFYLLDASEPNQETFENYTTAVDRLPVKPQKARVATWPVATIIPFLAQPNRQMFLKPTVTQQCARDWDFGLRYRPNPNWITYRKLLEFSDSLLQRLRPLGARDFIDVQSFIWVVAKYRE